MGFLLLLVNELVLFDRLRVVPGRTRHADRLPQPAQRGFFVQS
jgi:hypothetical protein